jgi:hypothetical protein
MAKRKPKPVSPGELERDVIAFIAKQGDKRLGAAKRGEEGYPPDITPEGATRSA